MYPSPWLRCGLTQSCPDPGGTQVLWLLGVAQSCPSLGAALYWVPPNTWDWSTSREETWNQRLAYLPQGGTGGGAESGVFPWKGHRTSGCTPRCGEQTENISFCHHSHADGINCSYSSDDHHLKYNCAIEINVLQGTARARHVPT